MRAGSRDRAHPRGVAAMFKVTPQSPRGRDPGPFHRQFNGGGRSGCVQSVREHPGLQILFLGQGSHDPNCHCGTPRQEAESLLG